MPVLAAGTSTWTLLLAGTLALTAAPTRARGGRVAPVR
jgi:hypothetical protein